ncbi:MAG: nuclear transport factor 2 family protein [Novosphingobium sp.]|nr:nuclear transport factor 2 family protein [Novosphingobium sp.]
MTEFVAADSGIRQLHARFVDATWRKDHEAFGQCFARDGEWKIAGMHIRGRDEIASTFARLLGACEKVQIIAGTPLLEVGEGTAIGRVNVTELAKMGDGSSAMTLGVYYDRYVDEDGRWRFQWRHWGLHYRGPVDLSADVVRESPDFGAFPNMPGADAPTFTKRFA